MLNSIAAVFAAQYSAISLLEDANGVTRETRAMRGLVDATLAGIYGEDAAAHARLKQAICAHLTPPKRGAAA